MRQQFQQTMGVMGLTDDHFLADRMFEVPGAKVQSHESMRQLQLTLINTHLVENRDADVGCVWGPCSASAHELRARFDSDQDGSLSFEEFASALGAR